MNSSNNEPAETSETTAAETTAPVEYPNPIDEVVDETGRVRY